MLYSHLSSQPCALDGSQSSPVFLSICTGSLSAAAVASSRNLTELLQVAPQIVTVAFHIGLEALRRSLNLEDSEGSWATVVKDVDLEDLHTAVEQFNKTLDDRYHKRVYVSAVCEASVTISGPPSITQVFFRETNLLKKARKLQLPIKAAFHARHLFPIPHSRIFSNVRRSSLQQPLRHVMISPCSGMMYRSVHLEGLLHEISDEILQQPIDWSAATQQLSKLVTPSTIMTPIGPCYATNTLSNWLPLQPHEQVEPPSLSLETPSDREGSGAIAIVGMSTRLPGSETLEEFWEVLKRGRDLYQEIPSDRFDVKTCYDPSGKAKNTSLTPYGVFLDRPGYFDPRFFNMSPREAMQTDPQQRLVLLTTYEALENAGYSPNRTPSTNTRRIASFIGQTGDDYREKKSSQSIDTYFITGGIRAFGPGRLNYHFGWEGPSYSLDTACSSSATSIQLACSALLARECDMAVGGGANLLTSPDMFAGLSRGGFLSKTQGCKTFDQEADGYIRGEGCGVVVLKRLEDALAERDNILAVVRGATTNHSAEAASITRPHGETQERLFKTVLDESGVLPCEVDLAEIHGTGTQAGDATESRSVTNVLCQGRTSENPLTLSTVKPNIGHGEAASGISSLVKAVLMLKKNTVPPHVGIKGSLSDKLPPFKDLNVRLCFEETPFSPRANGDGKRRILINNFDAAGGNTSMLLEDPPQLLIKGQDPRSRHIIAISAKSESALAKNSQNLSQWLNDNRHVRVEDLSYTTTSRRMHYDYRKAFSVSSVRELVTALGKYISRDEPCLRRSGQPSAVFCFTGQGSQYASMASTLYRIHPTFRDLINDYDQICISHGFSSFKPIIEGESLALECPTSTQLATVAIELALAFLWRSWGVEPSAVVGHSLGEYVALCYARVISPSDLFYLVGKRAELIRLRCTPNTHAMLAVQSDRSLIEKPLQNPSFSKVEIACLNGPSSTVLCGPVDEIQRLDVLLASRGTKTKSLTTQYAFHSSQLDVIMDDFEAIAQKIQFADPLIPIASTMRGDVVTMGDVFSGQYLRQQSRKPVQFQAAIAALRSDPVIGDKTVWIEMGTNPTCLNMIRSIHPETRVALPSLRKDQDDWQTISASVASAYNAGLDINWSEYQRPFEQSLQMVQLPNYAFDLKNYWMSQNGDTNIEGVSIKARTPALQVDFSPTDGLQRIEKREIGADTIHVTFASDASNLYLNKVLQGHVVNGVALCPTSVYGEMAIAAASYIHQITYSGPVPTIDIKNMTVVKPLIITPEDTNQTIFVDALLKRGENEVELQYSTRNESNCQIHAQCVTQLGNAQEWAAEWSENSRSILPRARQLRQASSDGNAHRLLRPMVYKLFGAFVDYDEEYQGLQEVHLDSNLLEATASVKFCASKGSFVCNPYWIDSIAHVSGFVLNGTEWTPSDSVFISHGWKSFRIMGPLSADKTYQSYVRMQPSTRRGIFAGDVHLFEGDEIVAVCRGLEFQQIKRKVLGHLLPKAGTASAAVQSYETQCRIPSIPARTLSEASAAKLAPHHPLKGDHSDELVSRIIDVIIEELGLETSELDEDVDLSDLGVDSLMSSSILTTLRDRLGICIPASSFVECRSVSELRAHFGVNSHPSSMASSSHCSEPQIVAEESSNVRSTLDILEFGFPQVLEIIAQEVGIDVSELEDEACFSNLGIDSLLTISIIGNLNIYFGEELPASLFVQYTTVNELSLYLQVRFGLQQPSGDESENSDTQSKTDEESTGHVTPITEFSDYEQDEIQAISLTETMRSIVAVGTGIVSEDVKDETSLVELGMDSFMAMSLLMRFRDQTGLVLTSTFFIDNPNFSCIKRALDQLSGQVRDVGSSLCVSLPMTVQKHESTSTKPHKVSSILLQGSSSCKEPCLFLIPDGSGSPSSYIGLPVLNHTGAVYGLSSPFLADPSSFKMSLQDLVASYIAELRRIQPTGPYYIGGWSIGGICAFEAASQLIQTYEEEVASLILIDAPCPTILPPIPIEDIDFLQSVGALDSLKTESKFKPGNQVTPAALGLRDGVREHFAGSINALRQYDARAIDPSHAPKSVVILWARHGVWQTLGAGMEFFNTGSKKPQQHPTTSWLMDTRASYETCGWEELLPGSVFTCHTIQGDHFSIMQKPGVVEMGAKISSSLVQA